MVWRHVPCSTASAPRYDGPLEYFTMWMCLFLSPAACELLEKLQGHNPNWGALEKIRMSLSAAQPIHPHPLHVLFQLLVQCTS